MMKKLLLSTLMVGALAVGANAQDDFNKWSIEVSGGPNKAMKPLTPGFYSPTLNLAHGDVGVRYMFNEKWGWKLDYGFGRFSEASQDNNPTFETNYWRANLQGVVNLGRVFGWETFTRRFNILGHAGAGIGRLTPQANSVNSEWVDFQDDVYNLIAGITGQVRLSDRIALTGDITTIANGRQNVTFDGGMSIDPTHHTFYGPGATWWTGTLGLTFYLGNNATHADWTIREDRYATKEELANQIGEIRDMLRDSDGDGVPDYLDKEPNTPAGARVDSHGRTLDSDGDGIPDHLDKCPFVPGPASNDGCPVEDDEDREKDFFKQAINDGYVNVYFAFDSAKPLGYSASAANYVSNFMKRNPGVRVELKGYADEIGPEDYNQRLSERRAKAVYDIIIASGIDAGRLTYRGYGEDTSVDKRSADARQLARRVSFEVQ